MKRVVIGLLAVMALLGGVFGAGPHSSGVQASTPGTTVKPLLSCPDVSGVAPVSLFDDIFAVANRYGAATGQPNYHPLFDVKDANGTIDLFNDIFYVAEKFGVTCPTVDLQVAKATLWGIDNVPVIENEAAIEAIGYYQGSSDVPGQGVHYIRFENWDGTFDPEAPEGLVYQNGKFAAQLYVTDGNVVGWGTHAATSCCPVVPHRVDLEGAADGPQCSPACSWAGTLDGWHMHYYLCTAAIGTSGALAIPGMSASSCDTFTGSQPLCTAPVTVQPCYRWGQNVGWMGHLWNHQLNPNQIADTGGNNGRFADCIPDGANYKADTCPA